MSRLKEPVSALTHLGGAVAALLLSPLLLVHGAARGADFWDMVGFAVFMASLVLLYSASAVYHSFDRSPRTNLILKRVDHMMIFVLIAGSYTPVCIMALPKPTGSWMLALIWTLAVIGMGLKWFIVACPRWVSSVLYIAMGWTCLLAFPQLLRMLPAEAFGWLLAGGLLYTAGGVIYALKLGRFNRRFPAFGSHELFHVFVLAGSLCHFLVMYRYLPLP